MENETLVKRKTVYLKQPRDFEISPCKCGNVNLQWSEYEKHIWCDKCQIDYQPPFEDGGLFSIPIAIRTATLLEVYFHRMNLETQKVEAFTSEGYYVPAINFYLDFNFSDKVDIIFKYSPSGEKEFKVIGAELDLNDYLIKIKDENIEIKEKILELITYTISTTQIFKEWKLKVNVENNELSLIRNEEFDLFQKFILNQKLEHNFPDRNKGKSHKI